MKSHRRKRRSLVSLTTVLVVIGACLVGIWFLSADARRELDALATANSESSQWSIAQSEVELLALEVALLEAMISDSPAALDTVRRRFDVFYARQQTLQRSVLLAQAREDPEVAAALDRISAMLDAALGLIDGPDDGLRAGLGQLVDQVDAAHRDLRSVTLDSLRVFAGNAETQRERVADALRDLAGLTLVLVLILIGTVIALIWSLALGRRRTAEIARARRRLRTIVGTSLDGVLVVDRGGIILDFNGAAERIFGYSLDEAIGAPMADLIIPDHLRAAHDRGMAEYLTSGRRMVLDKGLVQMEARDKSGRNFPVELSLATVDSEDGDMFVSFIRDISDRLTAEQQLVEARDRALAGEQAKAELLAIMSHEMRTPLNGILGGLDLLAQTPLSQRQKGFLDTMDRSGRMLLHHVNAVLDISRDNAGKTVLHPEIFDPAELLRDVADIQAVQADARGNVIRADTADTIGHRLGDRARLQQVLVNLLANATKFTRNGQITLTARAAMADRSIRFEVADTGIGIAPEDQARIFDDFVTLDTRYAREVEGTGLGLGIARRLVSAMGGEMGVDSVPGAGSLFWLQVPMPRADPAPDQAATLPAAPAASPADPRPLSVLIVEDNEINRLVAREMLALIGCETIEACDGVEALDIAMQHRFDLILMDISMPRRDGIEATGAIRAGQGPNAATPIVALTAHALPSEIVRFRAAGMADVLIKPLSQSALVALLTRICPDWPITVPDPTPQGAGVLADDLRARALGELDALLCAMSDSLDRRDNPAELAQTAHKAAGLAAVLGQETLQNALATLELALADLEGTPEETEALSEMLAELRAMAHPLSAL